MERRGRPKIEKSPLSDLRIFERIYTDAEGVKTVWRYDLDKNPRGPLEVETIWPKGHELYEGQNNFAAPAKKSAKVAKSPKATKDLPKSKRRYINPTNGKEVGYTRAKMLGLV